MKNFSLIATVLSVVLTATVAHAESQMERQACESDAFRVCGAQIPDRHNVFLCMMANKSQLSPPCRSVMAQYSQPRSRHEEAASRSTTTGQGD
jgi:hypothetical protein